MIHLCLDCTIHIWYNSITQYFFRVFFTRHTSQGHSIRLGKRETASSMTCNDTETLEYTAGESLGQFTDPQGREKLRGQHCRRS